MSDLGLYALRFGLAVALIGAVAGCVGGVTRRPEWSVVARRSVWLVCGLASLAMLALFFAFATNDFRLEFVADHSARSMTLPYRLAALWGGQDGSQLLWLWMLSAYSAAAVWFHRKGQPRLLPWVCAVLLGNSIFFLFLLNFITNPFTLLPAGDRVSDGAGLNPLLQHPIMTIHPVMLYAGFTGFAVPFAFALGALITRERGTAWLRATRRWTLVPWFFLSLGILLGGRWAYEVLGWGGYWAWDPVENASLMPWLAATAYLHSVMIQEKRDMLRIWNLVLIGLTYSLCLFGTFLTRSGVVASVHSFTAAGWFGYIFLAYLLFFACAYFLTVWVRRRFLRSPHRLESMVSREASFVLNNWVFMGLLAVVFWGTLFPVVSEAARGVKISVGPKFFNTMAGPLAILLLVLTGVGPLIAWRRASWTSLRRQFVIPTAVGGVAAVVVAAAMGRALSLYPLVFWSLSAFVLATIVQDYGRAIRARMRSNAESPLQALATLLRKNQQRYGGYVVHLGVVFILIAVAGAAFDQERLENLRPGEARELDGYRIEYLTAQPLPKQHYGGARARLALFRHGKPLGTMVPEKRMYWLEQQPASVPAIYSTWREDLYVTLTALEPDGSATLKIHRNPLVNWIWIGGYTLVFGAILLLWPHPERRSGRQAE